MFCYNCGHHLDDDDKFCPSCGARVKNSDSEEKVVDSEDLGAKRESDRDYISDNDIFFGEKISSSDRKYDAKNNQASHFRQAKVKESNGMAVAGLICAFIVPILGLILSIIAYDNLKKAGEPTRIATIGIVVAVCSLVFSVVVNILSLAFIPFI